MSPSNYSEDYEPLSDDDEVCYDGNIQGWLTVIGGICTHLIVGNEYLWGNVNTYIISYFHNSGDLTVTNNKASIILPL